MEKNLPKTRNAIARLFKNARTNKNLYIQEINRCFRKKHGSYDDEDLYKDALFNYGAMIEAKKCADLAKNFFIEYLDKYETGIKKIHDDVALKMLEDILEIRYIYNYGRGNGLREKYMPEDHKNTGKVLSSRYVYEQLRDTQNND